MISQGLFVNSPCFLRDIEILFRMSLPLSQSLSPFFLLPLSFRTYIEVSDKFRACFDCQTEKKTLYLSSEYGDPVFLAPFVEEATFSPIHCQNQVTVLALMVHAFSPNIHRTQAGLRPAWLKLQVPGQSRMHSKAMSDKKNQATVVV